jgi:hypothetical protein
VAKISINQRISYYIEVITFLFKIALELRFLLNSRLRRAILATSYEPSSAEVRLWRLRVLEDSIVGRGKLLSWPQLLRTASKTARGRRSCRHSRANLCMQIEQDLVDLMTADLGLWDDEEWESELLISKMLVFMLEGRAVGITGAGHSVMQGHWSITLAALPRQRAATIPAVMNLHYVVPTNSMCSQRSASAANECIRVTIQ